MRLVAAGLLLLASAVPATPQSRRSDPHIQNVFYDADRVVALRGAMGWQIQVEFAADERIENVSIGDATAWQVTPNKRANMLFLKPLAKNGATNMTVVTSQRRYTFALSTGPRLGWTPWVVRFAYPPPPAVAVVDAPPPPPINLHFGYSRAGDPTIMPSRVWDDGRQTYFEFAEQTPMPAIFLAEGRKDETLVNVSTRGRVQVVQQVGQRFYLRSGNRLATITRAP